MYTCTVESQSTITLFDYNRGAPDQEETTHRIERQLVQQHCQWSRFDSRGDPSLGQPGSCERAGTAVQVIGFLEDNSRGSSIGKSVSCSLDKNGTIVKQHDSIKSTRGQIYTAARVHRKSDCVMSRTQQLLKGTN